MIKLIKKHGFFAIIFTYLCIVGFSHNSLVKILGNTIDSFWRASFYLFLIGGTYFLFVSIGKPKLKILLGSILIVIIGIIIRTELIGLGFVRPLRVTEFIGNSYFWSNHSWYAGWGSLLSIFFIFMPHKISSIFIANAILGSISPIIFYYLSKELFRNKKVGIYSATLWALCPLYLLISCTESYTAPALFFTILTFLFFFKFHNHSKIDYLLASLCFLGVAIKMRPEYVFLLPMYFITLWIYSKNSTSFQKTDKKQIFYSRLKSYGKANGTKLMILLFLLIITPYFVVLINNYSDLTWDTKLHGKKMDNSKWYTEYPSNYLSLAKENIKPNFRLLISNTRFLLVITRLLFAIGLLFLVWNKEKSVLFLLIFSSIVFVMYTSMHGEKLNMSAFKYLPSLLIPLILGAGYGLYQIKKMIPKKYSRVFLVIFFILVIITSYKNVKAQNLDRIQTPFYKEYQLVSTIENVDPSCDIIGNGLGSMFLFVHEFSRWYQISTIPEFKQILHSTDSNCVYYYDGYYTFEKDQEEGKSRMYNITKTKAFLKESGFNEKYSSKINDKEIFLYYLKK